MVLVLQSKLIIRGCSALSGLGLRFGVYKYHRDGLCSRNRQAQYKNKNRMGGRGSSRGQESYDIIID